VTLECDRAVSSRSKREYWKGFKQGDADLHALSRILVGGNHATNKLTPTIFIGMGRPPIYSVPQ